jgi:hypothetical protein
VIDVENVVGLKEYKIAREFTITGSINLAYDNVHNNYTKKPKRNIAREMQRGYMQLLSNRIVK